MERNAIGFIGLGQMGRPMASHLAARGHAVMAFDVQADARASLSTVAGVTIAGSAHAVADACDRIILMLPDSPIVDRLLWEDGFAERLAPGSLLIDMGSSHPVHTRENARRLAAQDVALVDAPVSGGVRRAVSAQLSIMMGGTSQAVDRARPLLECLGTTLTHCGDSGAGHAVKALNNYVSAAGLLATCEALDAAEKFGIDPLVANGVFNTSTGRNNTTDVKVEAFMLSGKFNSGFALSLMRKDLQTALSLMKSEGAGHALAQPCVEIWQQAEAMLPRGADHTEMYRHVQRGRSDEA